MTVEPKFLKLFASKKVSDKPKKTLKYLFICNAIKLVFKNRIKKVLRVMNILLW